MPGFTSLSVEDPSPTVPVSPEGRNSPGPATGGVFVSRSLFSNAMTTPTISTEAPRNIRRLDTVLPAGLFVGRNDLLRME